MTKTLILNSKQIEQKINRIAYEIYENNYDEKEIIIAGIDISNPYISVRPIFPWNCNTKAVGDGWGGRKPKVTERAASIGRPI